jgi:hypothetical protein
MNWFRRHLNWTWVLASLLGAPLLVLVVSFIIGWLDPYANYISDTALIWIEALISLAVSFGVGGWVLSRKKRDLLWLFILFIPFGWIIFLSLANRSQSPSSQV